MTMFFFEKYINHMIIHLEDNFCWIHSSMSGGKKKKKNHLIQRNELTVIWKRNTTSLAFLSNPFFSFLSVNFIIFIECRW